LIAIWIFSFIKWPAEIDKNCRNVYILKSTPLSLDFFDTKKKKC
jgi:hypothetical protein